MLCCVRRLALTLFVLVLAWSMLPGGVELLENASHLVAHGDLAHPSKSGHTPFNPEHGCGGGFHLCSCCHAQTSETLGDLTVDRPTDHPTVCSLSNRPSLGLGFPQAPTEPPRA